MLPSPEDLGYTPPATKPTPIEKLEARLRESADNGEFRVILMPGDIAALGGISRIQDICNGSGWGCRNYGMSGLEIIPESQMGREAAVDPTDKK